jgi:flagellar protein FliJ
MTAVKHSLQALARIRVIAVDEARRELATRLDEETRAAERERTCKRVIAREREAAESIQTQDAAVEAFAAWLPVGQAELDTARRVRTRAEAASARARASLNAARASLETIESMLAASAAKQRLDLERREQAELDEFAIQNPQRRMQLP